MKEIVIFDRSGTHWSLLRSENDFYQVFPVDLMLEFEISETLSYNPVLFYMGRLEWLWNCVEIRLDLYCYAVQVFNSAFVSSAENLPVSFTTEFAVKMHVGDVLTFCRLRQFDSVPFSSKKHESLDFMFKLDPPRVMKNYCIGQLPRWKKCDAIWPLVENERMIFVGQLDGFGRENSKRFNLEDDRAFVFWKEIAGIHEVKVFCLPMRYQSVEDHYRQEQNR